MFCGERTVSSEITEPPVIVQYTRPPPTSSAFGPLPTLGATGPSGSGGLYRSASTFATAVAAGTPRVLDHIYLDSALRVAPTTASADFLADFPRPYDLGSLSASARISPGITHALHALPAGST